MSRPIAWPTTGAWLDGDTVAVLPERGAAPLERALPDRDESAASPDGAFRLAGSERDLVVVSPIAALWQRTLRGTTYPSGGGSGSAIASPARADRGLLAAGYDPTPEVTGIGEMAVRGGLVDLWPPGEPDPVRIEQFGDEVDAIRVFDPTTQASRSRRKEIHPPRR